jgi:hypothetical protein
MYGPPAPPETAGAQTAHPGSYFPPASDQPAVDAEASAPSPADAPSKPPGVWLGLLAGCGMQILGLVIFMTMVTLTTNLFGALWGFMLFTVAAIALMFSKRWRRFATGILIISAATWIIVIGPCLGLYQEMTPTS